MIICFVSRLLERHLFNTLLFSLLKFLDTHHICCVLTVLHLL